MKNTLSIAITVFCALRSNDYLGPFASLPDMHDSLCESGTKTIHKLYCINIS